MSDRLQAATNAIRAQWRHTPIYPMNNPVTSLTVRGHWCSPQLPSHGSSYPNHRQRKRRGHQTRQTYQRATARAPVIGPATQPAPEDQERSEIVAQAPVSDPTGMIELLGAEQTQPQGDPEDPVANQANPVETAKEAETVPEAKEVTLANELQAQKEGDFAKAKMFYGIYASMITTRKRNHSPPLTEGESQDRLRYDLSHFGGKPLYETKKPQAVTCILNDRSNYLGKPASSFSAPQAVTQRKHGEMFQLRTSHLHFDQIALGSRSLDLIGFGLFLFGIPPGNMKTLLVTSLLLLDSVTSRLGIDLPSSSHEAIPDLNFPPEDTTIEPPWFPGPSTPPSLSPTASALNEKPAEPIPMPSTPEGIFTADGSSPPSKRKWESDASSPEDFAMADASPSSSKRGQDPDSPTEKRGKIRSVADIMEETSRVVTRSQRKLEPSGKRCFRPHSLKDMSLQQIGGSESKFILKSTFHPGELPSGGLPQFFDIYNWNYVQASSQGKIKGNRNRMAPEDGSLGWFIDVLNSCKDPRTRDPHSFSWIPRAQAVSILEEYKRLDFDFGDQFQSLDRSQTLRDIVLKVSDEKLDLDKYPVFTNIHTTLEASLKSRMQSEPDEWSLGRIKSIISHVQKLNKITTFLLISYLSLFKEHPNEYLSAELVSSILSFLEKFWMEIDGGKSDILKDHPLLQRNSELLKTSFSLLEGKQMSYANHVDFMNNEYKQLYPMAWNIIAYWVQINKKKIQTKSRIQRYYHRSVTELIGNIILSANSHRLKLKFNKYAIRM
ncbi:hypothetical protein PSHT_01626 [Puccinia striiformis]|uniref:Uncharacterized protein n=1 Tax=Puccinia striiformis TaxID=27350 RepID=A0A2S4WK70_9BASI|nr:hypothetical protein PSHT_01626 [Puccinia striiformis]